MYDAFLMAFIDLRSFIPILFFAVLAPVPGQHSAIGAAEQIKRGVRESGTVNPNAH
jgi:hypothetical protein